MGKQPPENIIDSEIISLIRLLNSVSYVETTNSCSGYSDTVPTAIVNGGVVQGHFRSNGHRRKWTGRPYISFLAIGNRENRGKCLDFVDYLISRLVFHNEDEKKEQYCAEFEFHRMKIQENAFRDTPRYAEFKELAQYVGMTEKEYGRIFPLFIVTYNLPAGFTIEIMVRACIDSINGHDIFDERTPEEVMKIWKLIEHVARDFIEKNK